MFLLSIVPIQAAADRTTNAKLDSIWNAMERQIGRNPEFSRSQYIDSLALDLCDDDYECLRSFYEETFFRLEKDFHLPDLIEVTKSFVSSSKKAGVLEEVADCHMDLYRYYDALGLRPKATLHLDSMLALNIELGNKNGTLRARWYQSKYSLDYRGKREVANELQSLLIEAESLKDAKENNLVVSIKHSLVALCLDMKDLDLAEKYLLELDTMPFADPLLQHEYGIKINNNIYWAQFYRQKGDNKNARRRYQNTYALSLQEPSRWIEIYTLLNLGALSISEGELDSAKAYIKTAKPKSLALETNDQTAKAYHLEKEIALLEKDFESAYFLARKAHEYDSIYSSESYGFNLETHYLTLEKEQLAAEKKQKELLLDLSQIQFRFVVVVAILVLLLAIGFVIAFYQQRKARVILVGQIAVSKKQAEELRHLDTLKAQFFANISHELRTPLTLLSSPLKKLLREEGLSAKQTKLLNIAGQSAQQLRTLVDQILDFRKLESGEMMANYTPTNLSTFSKSYMAQFESLAEQKNIVYDHHINFTPELIVNLDREKYRQILYNLLSNAFKFTHSNGRVSVRLELNKEHEFCIVVADTGPGIEADDLGRIFDRYFQSSNPKKNYTGGSGIGLALCKEYAELFGGSARVNSSFGKGASFEVFFPVEVLEQNDSPVLTPETDLAAVGYSIPESQNTTDTTRPQVLVVEDNDALRDYLGMLLEDHYTVHLVENGQEALTFLATHGQIDLILSDLMMPVMNGYDLVKQLKQDSLYQGIPIVMLTARAELNDKLKALRFGVDDYLTKPFEDSELLARIENLLGNQFTRRELQVESSEKQSEPKSAKDKTWLDRVESHVQRNLDDTSLSIPDIADALEMSESSLLRKLKTLVGLSPIQYLQEARLDRARKHLEEGTFKSIKDLAQQVGYANPRTFSRNFVKRFGKRPSDY